MIERPALSTAVSIDLFCLIHFLTLRSESLRFAKMSYWKIEFSSVGLVLSNSPIKSAMWSSIALAKEYVCGKKSSSNSVVRPS